MPDPRSVCYLPPPTFEWFIESWDVGDEKGISSICVHVKTGERRVIVHENTPEGYAQLGALLSDPAEARDA